MELTEENKRKINLLSYEDLLRRWRFSPSGDPWFQGETGEYWRKRMNELKETVNHSQISKRIGWEK